MVAMTRWIRYSKSKIPLTPDDDIAKSNDPRTWSDFGWVKDSTAGVGIGFVFHADGIFGIDLDHAFDDEGNLKDWALKLLEQLPATFIEISPSGKGLHIIGKGTVGQGRKVTFEDGAVEVYDRGRYFTMTGKPFGKSILRLSKIDSHSVIEFAESIRSTSCQQVGLQSQMNSNANKEILASDHFNPFQTSSQYLSNEEIRRITFQKLRENCG